MTSGVTVTLNRLGLWLAVTVMVQTAEPPPLLTSVPLPKSLPVAESTKSTLPSVGVLVPASGVTVAV